jgi:CheY-like chemotaxis protein
MKLRVLLVDDDADILESWRILLEDRYDVSTAVDGREALALVERSRFDVIVLDMMMPVMDGPAFKRAADARGIHTPVVVVSAGCDVRAQAHAIGVRDVLTKPVDPEHLQAAIERLGGGPTSGGPPPGGGPGGQVTGRPPGHAAQAV